MYQYICLEVMKEYRAQQLLQSLRQLEEYLIEASDEPNSLLDVIHRQGTNRNLTHISDETFNFFKLLYVKVKHLINFDIISMDVQNVHANAVHCLEQDVQIAEMWCDLFTKKHCQCTKSTKNSEDDVSDDADQSDEEDSFPEDPQVSDEKSLEYELKMCLILDILQMIINYFMKVVLSDLLGQVKDNKLEKTKSLRLHATISTTAIKKKDVIPKQVPYPCGICKKECVDVVNMVDVQFEDFSVLCEKCDKCSSI